MEKYFLEDGVISDDVKIPEGAFLEEWHHDGGSVGGRLVCVVDGELRVLDSWGTEPYWVNPASDVVTVNTDQPIFDGTPEGIAAAKAYDFG